jgi:hypothetical protein
MIYSRFIESPLNSTLIFPQQSVLSACNVSAFRSHCKNTNIPEAIILGETNSEGKYIDEKRNSSLRYHSITAGIID